jgi:hypothetical protein
MSLWFLLQKQISRDNKYFYLPKVKELILILQVRKLLNNKFISPSQVIKLNIRPFNKVTNRLLSMLLVIKAINKILFQPLMKLLIIDPVKIEPRLKFTLKNLIVTHIILASQKITRVIID